MGAGGPPAGPDRLTADERSELEQLRRDNARLRMERGILKKAAVSFARETQE
jgi:transposase